MNRLGDDFRIERVEGSVALIRDERIIHSSDEFLGRHPGHDQPKLTALRPAIALQHFVRSDDADRCPRLTDSLQQAARRDHDGEHCTR